MPDFGDISIPAGGSTSSETSTQQTPETPSGGSPNVVKYDENTMFEGVPGYNEPVRFGDLQKRQQADYTRKTQEAQRQRTQFETERAAFQTHQQTERARLESLAQTLIQRQGQGNPNQVDPLYQKIASAKYIDGPLMSEFINTVQEKGFAPIVKAFQERDTITQNMYQEILELRKLVTGLTSARTAEGTETKIDRWLQEGGFPKEAKKLAKEIYSAYEGDDLDNEFPNIFAERWNELQTILRAQDKARVEEARRQGTRLPGRGGNGTPGKSIGLKGHEKARDVASALWDAMQVGDNT